MPAPPYAVVPRNETYIINGLVEGGTPATGLRYFITTVNEWRN